MYAGLLLAAAGLTALTLSEARLAMTIFLWWIMERKVGDGGAAATCMLLLDTGRGYRSCLPVVIATGDN